MSKEVIDIGSAADDGAGDPGRTAFDKVNSNFTEIYNLQADYFLLDGTRTITGQAVQDVSYTTSSGDLSVTGLDSTVSVDNALIFSSVIGMALSVEATGSAAFSGLTGLSFATQNSGSADLVSMTGLIATIKTPPASTGGCSAAVACITATTSLAGTGTFPEIIGYYASNMGGSNVTTATGITVEKQENSTTNHGIFLKGDGVGADIVFGAGKDANIYYDGTDLAIDTALVGSGTMDWVSQTANAITTETLTEYVTIKIGGVSKKIAIVA